MRADFDMEWDDHAEDIIADLTIHSNDSDSQNQFKLQSLQTFNMRLQRRYAVKQFLLDYPVLAFSKDDQLAARNEIVLSNRLYIVSWLMSKTHFHAFYDSVINEYRKAYHNYISVSRHKSEAFYTPTTKQNPGPTLSRSTSVQKRRRNGKPRQTPFSKRKRSATKNELRPPSPLSHLPDATMPNSPTSAPVSPKSATASPSRSDPFEFAIKPSPAIMRKAQHLRYIATSSLPPVDIEKLKDMEDFCKLSDAERNLCSHLHIEPRDFLELKSATLASLAKEVRRRTVIQPTGDTTPNTELRAPHSHRTPNQQADADKSVAVIASRSSILPPLRLPRVSINQQASVTTGQHFNGCTQLDPNTDYNTCRNDATSLTHTANGGRMCVSDDSNSKYASAKLVPHQSASGHDDQNCKSNPCCFNVNTGTKEKHHEGPPTENQVSYGSNVTKLRQMTLRDSVVDGKLPVVIAGINGDSAITREQRYSGGESSLKRVGKRPQAVEFGNKIESNPAECSGGACDSSVHCTSTALKKAGAESCIESEFFGCGSYAESRGKGIKHNVSRVAEYSKLKLSAINAADKGVLKKAGGVCGAAPAVCVDEGKPVKVQRHIDFSVFTTSLPTNGWHTEQVDQIFSSNGRPHCHRMEASQILSCQVAKEISQFNYMCNPNSVSNVKDGQSSSSRYGKSVLPKPAPLALENGKHSYSAILAGPMVDNADLSSDVSALAKPTHEPTLESISDSRKDTIGNGAVSCQSSLPIGVNNVSLIEAQGIVLIGASDSSLDSNTLNPLTQVAYPSQNGDTLLPGKRPVSFKHTHESSSKQNVQAAHRSSPKQAKNVLRSTNTTPNGYSCERSRESIALNSRPSVEVLSISNEPNGESKFTAHRRAQRLLRKSPGNNMDSLIGDHVPREQHLYQSAKPATDTAECLRNGGIIEDFIIDGGKASVDGNEDVSEADTDSSSPRRSTDSVLSDPEYFPEDDIPPKTCKSVATKLTREKSKSLKLQHVRKRAQKVSDNSELDEKDESTSHISYQSEYASSDQGQAYDEGQGHSKEYRSQSRRGALRAGLRPRKVRTPTSTNTPAPTRRSSRIQKRNRNRPDFSIGPSSPAGKKKRKLAARKSAHVRRLSTPRVLIITNESLSEHEEPIAEETAVSRESRSAAKKSSRNRTRRSMKSRQIRVRSELKVLPRGEPSDE